MGQDCPLHIQNNYKSSKLWVKLNCDLKVAWFILYKYGCNKGLILLELSRVLLSPLPCGHLNLTNTCVSIYRKAASPGHVAFLKLLDIKQSPQHPMLDDW